MTYYAGIDLHQETAFWTVKDEKGEIVEQAEYEVKEAETKKQARRLMDRGSTKAVLEPTCAWRLYKSWLEEEGIETTSVQPLKVKLMAHNKLKNDRVDSEILSELLRLGFVPEVSCVSDEKHHLRQLISTRASLVKQRAALKQKLREMLASENILIDHSNIFSGKAVEEVKSLNLSPVHTLIVGSLVSSGSALSSQIDGLESFLKDEYGGDPEIEILTSMPGVGLVTACTVSSIVGDWNRFPTPSHLTSFAGLVPSSRDSGKSVRRGGITKQGSRSLRAVMYEAAMGVTEKGGYLYNFYERIRERNGKKSARTALARKMLSVAWYLVKKGERFDSDYLEN